MNALGNYFVHNPAALAIVAGEILFWVALVVGLVTRYPLRMKRFSTVLLASVPLIDLAVLTVTVIDLSHGAKATFSHGLAAVYLGFSIVFGRAMVRWADVRFAHRFAGGPPPAPKPRGRAKVRHEWREWRKCVLACVLAAVLLLAAILVIGRPEQVKPLWDWLPRVGGIASFWLVAGPVWQELFGRDSEPTAAR
jgi:hypothetical protein